MRLRPAFPKAHLRGPPGHKNQQLPLGPSIHNPSGRLRLIVHLPNPLHPRPTLPPQHVIPHPRPHHALHPTRSLLTLDRLHPLRQDGHLQFRHVHDVGAIRLLHDQEQGYGRMEIGRAVRGEDVYGEGAVWGGEAAGVCEE